MRSIEFLLTEAISRLSSSSDSALLDAEILLCLAINKSRSHLRAWPERVLSSQHIGVFWELVQERQKGTPIAYITKEREFWSRVFYVTPDVLIPRPETELLIELSLKLIPADRPSKIIDLGTGSGIIAITLAAERPLAEVIAADLSLPALKVARLNAERNRINNLRFYHSDWFAEIQETSFDLIVSNPPYIAEDDSHLAQGDLRFEPKSSLCAKQQGLADIRLIASQARNRLQSGGHLLIEHGYDQMQYVQTLFKDLGYDNVRTYNDLSGLPRVVYGRH